MPLTAGPWQSHFCSLPNDSASEAQVSPLPVETVENIAST